jgi:hypothetical protein
MNTTKIAVVVIIGIAGLFCVSADRAPVDWSVRGGDQGGTHYSTLADINTSMFPGSARRGPGRPAKPS